MISTLPSSIYLFIGLFLLLTGCVACVRLPVITTRLFQQGVRGMGKLSPPLKFRFWVSAFLVLPSILLGLVFLLTVVLMLRDQFLRGGGVNGLSEVGMVSILLVPLYLTLETLSRPFMISDQERDVANGIQKVSE